MPDTLVRFDKVSSSYGHTRALTDISLEIKRGDYVVIAGPNGSGKSTLIRALLGIVPVSGTIELFGRAIAGFHQFDRIGYVPQKIYSFNPLFPASVEEIVQLGLLPHKHFPKFFTAKDKKAVTEVLDELGIEDLRHRSIQELSGGQQQKVFIARALVSTPDLLILDEPFNSLDSLVREKLTVFLRHLNREHGITILLVTHDLDDLGEQAPELLYLENKIVFYGRWGAFCDFKSDADSHSGEYFHQALCKRYPGKGEQK
ncbi:hypothetical protein AUK40_05970 [Candidatus Wirthbacteria bacterium CG2_30_54_11]|uniref:ABC transporter domain-containing protein n=1 Tax=Candidatus Wirthbacteria bacterium CG2_30_54_11 TaxID=1817892 RepID=A0A1J5IFS1_9BACT|nr:MAG: hypothetical protein AUK40_05970 [Candidatus Wirthbacteria bacterium CG2_30_54_11]